MKKLILSALSVVLLGCIVAYYFASLGVIEIENASTRKVDLLTVLMDDTKVSERAYFKEGEIETVKFNPNQVEQIEIKTQMATGAESKGFVKPGMFARIRARIQSDGSIDFGDSSFETSTEADSNWAEPAAGR